ncbi:hypothetical protein, conserved [Trypanosoma cruzi]|uniref:Uncharacterized protein n=1 Tax=Trypanosoma cruzi (strain CL Brener) TaxID=353153 RepID=Q4DFD3_TRYCC|nr:hypothetical protein, conserved [Trypanosoma cruzi]EAN91239.1 hypothetical protein, conserved [Trypanosoma cruzi]|eukprot:XP_813090.1 hypothetical protein [Trypanosoma cruzi strain CL Brener]
MSAGILGKTHAGVPSYRSGYVSPSGIKIQYSNDWVKHHPLEGDGLRTLLYLHLWKKNKGSESRLKDIRLPDTVVYEHNFPRAWYTYDGEAKEINKHPGKMLDAQSIYEHFSRSTPDCDVVAQFLTTCAQDNPAISSEGGLLTYVKFFTAESLREFLFSPERKPDGILQKFVVPKGETTMRKNSQLQVMWSPLVTVVYKRTNKQRLGDLHLPVHLRSATFDGDSHLSELSLIADESKARLESLCREVVDHFYFTDLKLITRMVLNFKIDDANRPWLLWCSSLRVSGDRLNPRNVRVPVALSMPIEVLNDGSSTRDRIIKSRDRQQQLLLLDKQLFELSRDYDFGHNCNDSHVREAKRLGLQPLSEKSSPNGQGKSFSRRNPPHPLHDAMRYLRVLSTEPQGVDLSNCSLSSAAQQQDQQRRSRNDSVRQSQATIDDAEDRVKSELTAMALDAWYTVYSSALSKNPTYMPTKDVFLAEPLVVSLQPPELERLVVILGLERNPVSEDPRSFMVNSGLIGPGRRLDRPFINAERDVREFFDELFASRGGEITQQCLANDRWIW